MEYDVAAIEVLRPVIEATRTALRKLDKDDVPARLRPVANSAARTLPKPLAVSLLEALDEDEWLRGKAAKQAKDSALAAYVLERKPGWEEVIAEEVEAVRSRNAERAEEDKSHAEAEQAARAAVEAERVADLRKTVEQLRQDAAGESRRRGAAVQEATDQLRAEVAELRSSLRDASDLATEERERRERLERQLDRTKRDLLTALRAAPEAAPEATGSAWAGDGPSLAKHADEVFAAAKARVEAGPETIPILEPPPAPDAHPPLPTGLSPDRPEAVDALLLWRGTVLIDGYNLAGTVGADLSQPATARAEVRDIVALLRGEPDVLVVWDSANGTDTRDREVFVPDADEELRRRARQDPAGVVVVSNDREVIDGVTAAGAVAVWSTALADWSRDR